MTKKDLYFALWACPLWGGIVGFIVGTLFQADRNISIVIMLGILSSYLALICLLIGEKYIIKDEDHENEN